MRLEVWDEHNGDEYTRGLLDGVRRFAYSSSEPWAENGVKYVGTTGKTLIEEDAIYPRDEEHRFRVYARRGDEIEVLACAGSPEALGVALVQLDEDERERGRRLIDLGAIGVLDTLTGRWLILPWHRPDVPVTFHDPARGEIPVEDRRRPGR